MNIPPKTSAKRSDRSSDDGSAPRQRSRPTAGQARVPRPFAGPLKPDRDAGLPDPGSSSADLSATTGYGPAPRSETTTAGHRRGACQADDKPGPQPSNDEVDRRHHGDANLPPPPVGLCRPGDVSTSRRGRLATGPVPLRSVDGLTPVGSDPEDWLEPDIQVAPAGADATTDDSGSLSGAPVGLPPPSPSTLTPSRRGHLLLDETGREFDPDDTADMALNTVLHRTGRDPTTVSPPLTPGAMYLLSRIDGQLSVEDLHSLGVAASLAQIIATLEFLWELDLVAFADE